MDQCSAKSKRSQKQCKNWAIRDRNVCRMHGANSTGPRTRSGKRRARKAVLKHGRYTAAAIIEQKKVMQFIKMSKQFIDSI